MTIRTLENENRKDASTDTRRGEISKIGHFFDDETFTYVELTEFLLTRSIESSGLSDRSRKKAILPMRMSLFDHMPPYIVFRSTGNTCAQLPREIRKYLLWWRTKRYCPSIVRSTVLRSGFSLTLRSTVNWCGTWCSRNVSGKFKVVKAFQKINHLPNSAQLSNKVLLWRNFRRMWQRHGGNDFRYMPMTYVLPAEGKRLQRILRRNDGVWILKPANNCGGRGIRMISRWYEVPGDRVMVAQRYLSKPRLVDGIKFDLRLYVLITCLQPLRVYIYSEGLVRLATERYRNDARNLYNRFMHLTNTSVNKFSPRFRMNEDPDLCKGNMWSLKALWKYLDGEKKYQVSTEIWQTIKDIALKTVISAESIFLRSLKTSAGTVDNFYQLYGFDVLLDECLRPWLLEVNDCPSLDPDTPLCSIIKGRLVSDYLNLVGFHVPDVLGAKDLKRLKKIYGEKQLCFDRQGYDLLVTEEDRAKRKRVGEISSREDYTREILKDLTADDTRILARYEDEIASTGRFERIFPTARSYEYFKYFENVGYHNRLLDAWENEYGADRSKGIARLKELCRRNYETS